MSRDGIIGYLVLCIKINFSVTYGLTKKTQHPYIAVGKGTKIDHPNLVQRKRTFTKILMIDPSEDIPIDTTHTIFDLAMGLYGE